ncbi:MAG: Txe/YoeB family addiction module toxin [Bacilli bacterium]|nr:Txe/YoeB family addiction module toxin [Bacilli bacterium]
MEVVYTKQAYKDFDKIKQYPSLMKKVQSLVELLKENPFTNPPSYEKLIGFKNVYSRRINVEYRLVYEVREQEKVVVIIRM